MILTTPKFEYHWIGQRIKGTFNGTVVEELEGREEKWEIFRRFGNRIMKRKEGKVGKLHEYEQVAV